MTVPGGALRDVVKRGKGVSLQALLVPLAGVGAFQERDRQSGLGVVRVLGSSPGTALDDQVVENVPLDLPKIVQVLRVIETDPCTVDLQKVEDAFRHPSSPNRNRRSHSLCATSGPIGPSRQDHYVNLGTGAARRHEARLACSIFLLTDSAT